MSTNNSTVETCTVKGTEHQLRLDPRESLLDVLRELLASTDTKKGRTVTIIEGIVGGRVQGGLHEH